MMKISPSILSCDYGKIAEELKDMERCGADYIHIDVMDGSFVPQITYGQPVVKSLRALTQLPFDVHLMVEHPECQIESFALSGADWITFHFENTVHVHRIVQQIHSLGKKAGIAICPATPVDFISEILPEIDIVLVMTVNPGFGGQKLIPSCVKKIAALKEIREKFGYGYKISVDGGVNAETAAMVVNAGADIVVSGSAFFSGALKWPV